MQDDARDIVQAVLAAAKNGDMNVLADSRPTERLRINGATEAEIEFLVAGQRVELNAMTSDQFVAFVEEKLKKYGAEKVIPDEEILANAYQAFVRSQRAKRAFAAELERIKDEPIDVPVDLAERVRGLIADSLEPWEAALWGLVDDGGEGIL
jgi:hypothetical protein